MRSLLRLFLSAFLLQLSSLAFAAPLSGTKSVGPTGDYASLTAAIADVNAVGNGLGGALVLELQASYVSTVETFPLTIPALTGASATNTLTIRPASGATALSISSGAAQTVDLNGAQFVTFDGRPSGVGSHAGSGGGTASQLTIEHTGSGVAVRFINEASGNTLRYTTLRSANTSATSGTVVFSTTTGANGNDNNTIDHCDIREVGSAPRNGIYSIGTTTTPEQANSGNTVSNCNVLNFVATNGVDAAGVRLDGGNDAWTVTGNSFYQPTVRTTVAANVRAIYVNNPSGTNFTINGNFIGGSAPNAGGMPWGNNPVGQVYRFQGIWLNAGSTTPSSVQGNTIANFSWVSSPNTSALPGVWCGIYVQAGNANIGTVTGNTIGSGTGTGSISILLDTIQNTGFGIGSDSSGTVAIANNTIGSMTTRQILSASSASLTGIQVTAGANTISNNTVGSTTTANSLNASNSSTSTTVAQQVTGILSSSAASTTITDNIVANLNNSSTQSTAGLGQIRGIVTSAGVNTITGNTVRNLSTPSRNSNTTTAQSVYGTPRLRGRPCRRTPCIRSPTRRPQGSSA